MDHTRLWHAFTPQMFRIGDLLTGHRDGPADGVAVTDEASAMEQLGSRPRMVEGHADNIKVTHPLDLPLAEFYLRRRSPDTTGGLLKDAGLRLDIRTRHAIPSSTSVRTVPP